MLYEVALSSEIIARADLSARYGQTHPIGNLSRTGHGCRCYRIYAVACAAQRGAGFMGAGPLVLPRNGAALSGGDGSGASGYHGQPVTRCRCTLGAGRRPALCGPCRRDRRDLGRPTGTGFHRNQAAGGARGGGEYPLLADPARRHPEPECCTRALADRIGAVSATCLRRAGAGHAALVAGSISRTPHAARAVGGDI